MKRIAISKMRMKPIAFKPYFLYCCAHGLEV